MKRILKISILMFFGLIWLGGSPANATDYSSTTMKKALLTGVERCYRNGLISTSAGRISEFNGFRKLILSDDNSHYIALPSGLTGIDDDDVSCEQLFMGYPGLVGGNFEGIFALSGRNSNPSSSAGKIELLEGMGYEKVDDGDAENERRINFTYNQTSYGRTSQVETDTIVAKLDSEGVITELAIEYTGNYAMPPGGATNGLAFFTVVDGKIRLARATTPAIYQHAQPTYYDTTKGVGDLWDGDNGFLADLRSTVSRRGSFSYKYTARGQSLNYEYSLEGNSTAGNYNPDAASDASYEITVGDIYGPVSPDSGINKALNSAIRYLSSGSLNSVNDLSFSDTEKIATLLASLKAHFFAGKNPSDYWACDVSDWADYGSYLPENEIHVTSDVSVRKDCRLDVSKATNSDPIHGFSGAKFDASGNTELSLSQTISEINRLVGELPDDTETVNPSIPGDGGGEGDGDNPNCYNSTSLSWILCAAIDLVGNTTNAIYDDIKDNYLEVGTKEMEADKNNNGVYYGWTQFRDIANIIFVIILLIVIFSQVTGLGLTNYGIKKVLPTLVIVAVLVNISFILCQLAVDVTNIVGDAIQTLLNDMAGKINYASSVGFGEGLGKILDSVGLTIAGVSIVGGGFALAGGFNIGSALILILATVITCFFSVVFFFVVLAVRKAGVLILVVLSPAAIVCYALPNTKKYFDKWLKLFTSLLVVYPVCSLLMGAGDFFSKILMTDSAGFMQSLTAVLLQVVPFFLVPSMVRGSLALAGNIGNKLGQMGKNLGRRASGSFARSDAANRMKISANQWGRTGGVGKALRKAPIIGGVVRTGDRVAGKIGQVGAVKSAKEKISNSKLGKVAAANRARKNALAEDAYNKMQVQDRMMTKRNELSDGSTLANALATADQKVIEELSNDELNSLVQNGRYQTSDGRVHEFNQDDADSVGRALGVLEADFQQHQGNTPEDKLMREKIMVRFNGMKKLLQTRYGSNGTGRIVESIYGLTYKEDGETLQNSDSLTAASQLARQLLKDDKLMSELHRNDPGSEQFIIDLANRGRVNENNQLTEVAIKADTNLAAGRAGYGNFSAGKVKPANLADNLDTLMKNWSKMEAGSPEHAQMAATFTQAINDYRTGSNFKENDIAKINAELKRGYDAERNNWIKKNAQALTGYVNDGQGGRILVNATGFETDAHGNVTNLTYTTTDANGATHTEILYSNANTSSSDALNANDVYSQQVSAFTPVKVGQPLLKIQQLRELPKIPEGYDRDGHWDYGAMGRVETKRDKLAYENWAKRTMEIEQQNREIEKANSELAKAQKEYEFKIQNNNNP